MLSLLGCIHPYTVWDPVLLEPIDRPVPAGLFATEPTRVEARACGLDYHGLDALLDEARAGGDGLQQISVEIERRYEPLPFSFRTILVEQCYVLRAYRVVFRVDDAR